MSKPTFGRTQMKEAPLSRFQAEVGRCLDYLLGRPSVDEILHENLVLEAGATTSIPHRLGRKLVGWEICRKRGPGDIYEDTTNTTPSLTLDLISTTNVTIDVRVY